MSDINLSSFAQSLNFPIKTGPAPAVSAGDGQQIVELQCTILVGFPDHEKHFPLYVGVKVREMVLSIERFGVQTPILVWQTADGRYIIISGHNRVNASQLAGRTTIPAIIRTDLTEKEAEELFFELNFRQRSLADMTLSQQILCVAAHYNMMKQQGKRTDLISLVESLSNPHDSKDFETSADSQQKLDADIAATSADPQQKSDTRSELAEEYRLTADKIQKYNRLATLYRPLLLLMDSDENDKPALGFLAGYELTFITSEQFQTTIHTCITDENMQITTDKAKLLRKYYEQGKLTDATIREVVEGKKKQGPRGGLPSVTVKPKVLSKFFEPDTPKKVIDDTIVEALEFYFEAQKKGADE